MTDKALNSRHRDCLSVTPTPISKTGERINANLETNAKRQSRTAPVRCYGVLLILFPGQRLIQRQSRKPFTYVTREIRIRARAYVIETVFEIGVW